MSVADIAVGISVIVFLLLAAVLFWCDTTEEIRYSRDRKKRERLVSGELYEVEIEIVYSWTEWTVDWRVRKRGHVNGWDVKGTAATRWGAKHQARKAVRRLRKGKPAEKQPRPNPEKYWI